MANAVRRTIYLPESLEREYMQLGAVTERSFCILCVALSMSTEAMVALSPAA